MLVYLVYMSFRSVVMSLYISAAHIRTIAKGISVLTD